MRDFAVVVTRLYSGVGGCGRVQFWTATRAPAVAVVVDVIDLNEIARWPMGFSGAMLLFSFFGGYTDFLLQLSVVTEDNDSWDLNMLKRQRPLINAAIRVPIIVHRTPLTSPLPRL